MPPPPFSSPYPLVPAPDSGRRGYNRRSRGRRRRGSVGCSPATSTAAATLVLVLSLLPPVRLQSRTALNAGNPDAKRLYDDLLSNYNKLVRPVVNTTDPLTVRIKLKLSQLIDVVRNKH